MGYLHHSLIAESCFHDCQRHFGLPETKSDQDVRTRWRSSYKMAEQVVYNKRVILKMNCRPSIREAGEAWGKNALNLKDCGGTTSRKVQGAAVLRKAAGVSQLLEGDKYLTVSFIMPSIFKLISHSLRQQPLTFSNRARPNEIGYIPDAPHTR